jgi:trans-2-enoyl-CoA reductase
MKVASRANSAFVSAIVYRFRSSCRRKGRIRIDDWEMRPDVQEKLQLWLEATTENIAEISDLEGYRSDFIIYLALVLMV